MYPTLFRIGPVPIQSHDFFVLAGTLCAIAFFCWEASRERSIDHRVVWVACGALVTGAIFAKLSTVWRYLSVASEPTLQGVLVYGGKSILGGLTGAYIGGLATKKVMGLRVPTGDLFAPAVALGMAVGRWGCFLSEQIGTPTSAPWGISVDARTAATMPMCAACAPGVPMHPSFLYEIAFHAAMFFVLLWVKPRIPVRGELFKIYLLSYALFRFAVEFVRGNQDVLFGLSFSQLFLIPASALLIGYFVRQMTSGAYTVPRFDPSVP